MELSSPKIKKIIFSRKKLIFSQKKLISENGIFYSSPKNKTFQGELSKLKKYKKKLTMKKFLIFWEMELSSPKLKKNYISGGNFKSPKLKKN